MKQRKTRVQINKMIIGAMMLLICMNVYMEKLPCVFATEADAALASEETVAVPKIKMNKSKRYNYYTGNSISATNMSPDYTIKIKCNKKKAIMYSWVYNLSGSQYKYLSKNNTFKASKFKIKSDNKEQSLFYFYVMKRGKIKLTISILKDNQVICKKKLTVNGDKQYINPFASITVGGKSFKKYFEHSDEIFPIELWDSKIKGKTVAFKLKKGYSVVEVCGRKGLGGESQRLAYSKNGDSYSVFFPKDWSRAWIVVRYKKGIKQTMMF